MFQMIAATDKHLHAAKIDEMHAWRKKVFIDENGWNLTQIEGREYDQYDDDQAIYILEYEDNGDLVHAQRMRPTAERSMLTDVFPSAIAAGPRSIMDGETWEMTRGFVTPKYRIASRDDLRAAMRVTILELALEAGVKRIVSFIDVRLLPYFVNSAYRFAPLGLPVPYGEGSGVAIEIEVSQTAIRHMAETRNVASLLPRKAEARDADGKLPPTVDPTSARQESL